MRKRSAALVMVVALAVIGTACTSGSSSPSTTAKSTTTTKAGSVTISSVSPISGPVGTVVVINGVNLGGATKVSFGGIRATPKSDTATQITVSVPKGAITGPVRVKTPAGKAKSSGKFTVT
jgi:hypothetical protein